MSDIRLHFEEAGSGKPLFLLHGNGESHEIFSEQVKYFSKQCRVIAVDTRGHGASPRGSAPFCLSQFAEDLKALFDFLKIEKADVLGFSDGGNIALMFALEYPELIDRLILNGANIKPGGIRAKYLIPIMLAYLGSLFGKNIRKRELLALMVHEPHIKRTKLRSIKADTLIIAGKDDMISGRHTREIAAAIPKSSLTFIDGDHFIAQKNPDTFNSAVENFFGQTDHRDETK